MWAAQELVFRYYYILSPPEGANNHIIQHAFSNGQILGALIKSHLKYYYKWLCNTIEYYYC